ncbi:protein-L-isoaspartate(D-aspartate) O-methyltransferase [Candidatus Woesearchaeota archaeon]|jgi:protein-L-isoaspartate(D-aspartate) O-methyltransferase|nr:protein-L-isoaspartate(D-aspartate) O-methyltransferase [Candidatus Woesearchaeota archaeon]MBT7062664.1 protein-L-isoaspartate(D-aspartate) O-methyltransferase [Candidatus Woesearchaeota archaeon]MBT7403139.1 protein-L-isoaspartate(D-aspartate) O-methyltransferase [Candidatus Woesearchaeota archaeon]
MNKSQLIESLKSKGALKTNDVIKAFEQVERENFVDTVYRPYAYTDEALPLFSGQTISQPYTVAVMTEALELHKSQRVLEVGTGSGYQAAIIAEIIGKRGILFTIERLSRLVDFAKQNLKDYSNVDIVLGNGIHGLPEKAPFDRIIVTAAASEFPKELFAQLRDGGKMVIPTIDNRLLIIIKKGGEPMAESLGSFVFVPLVND